MRIQVLSDLHFEHHRDGGESFVSSLDPAIADVVVLAGDIAADGIGEALDRLCRHFVRSSLVYVHGNHELYGVPLERLRGALREVEEHHSHFAWLDCSATSIGGVRFLGAPLWFERAPNVRALAPQMNDFALIPDFESWVYVENERARAFFEAELRRGDVVVTHHLPTPRSVAKRWRESPLNAFFVCDLEPLIRSRAPALWIHGHTHESVDLVIEQTRVVCNPFGYVRVEENRGFDDRKVVTVGA